MTAILDLCLGIYCRLAIRAPRFRPEADFSSKAVSGVQHERDPTSVKDRGRFKCAIRIPSCSPSLFFNSLAFGRIPRKSLKTLPLLLSKAYSLRPYRCVCLLQKSETRNCRKVVALDENHSGVAKPCSINDDSYVALRVAEEQSPVLRTENRTRDWRSYQLVDWNNTNSGVLDASVSLDPAFRERVIGSWAAHYENSDRTQGETGPKVVSAQSNTAKVQCGFNGEDVGLSCRSGHTTIVVTFPIAPRVPVE